MVEITDPEQIFDESFVDLFDKYPVKGDIMTVDYIPSCGTQVSIHGKVKGIISGRALIKEDALYLDGGASA